MIEEQRTGLKGFFSSLWVLFPTNLGKNLAARGSFATGQCQRQMPNGPTLQQRITVITEMTAKRKHAEPRNKCARKMLQSFYICVRFWYLQHYSFAFVFGIFGFASFLRLQLVCPCQPLHMWSSSRCQYCAMTEITRGMKTFILKVSGHFLSRFICLMTKDAYVLNMNQEDQIIIPTK